MRRQLIIITFALVTLMLASTAIAGKSIQVAPATNTREAQELTMCLNQSLSRNGYTVTQHNPNLGIIVSAGRDDRGMVIYSLVIVNLPQMTYENNAFGYVASGNSICGQAEDTVRHTLRGVLN